MVKKAVFFGEALPIAARVLSNAALPSGAGAGLLVRDIRGRISIALNLNRSESQGLVDELQREMARLGVFAASPAVLCADDFFDPGVIFEDPSILPCQIPGMAMPVRLLDRQVTGQDWLLNACEAERSGEESGVPYLVFFGVKGGVGRSTALALTAYSLAKAGKRVLLIDLDLESPGLSGLLLPPERLADFGVVDWLLEDAVGQGPEVIERMISVSPLSQDLRHEIRIAAAAGHGDLLYLDKLSRAYADVPEGHRSRRFSERVRRLVKTLAEREKPDVVLIDSRAGLHDLAALSVVGLASTAFLFGTGAAQSWQGYRALFAHWQSRPDVARGVRERLKMVSALFPEADQAARARSFLEESYTLFTETLYDELTPGASEIAEEDLFTFDMENSAAPHYPLRIKWSSRFQEFDPLQIPKGLFGDDDIRAAYGEFLDAVLQLVEDRQA
jgi:hypothetical protein